MSATHVITLDETETGIDYAVKAFCECGWSAPHWTHADEMPSFRHNDPLSDDAAAAEAYHRAKAEGDTHLAWSA